MTQKHPKSKKSVNQISQTEASNQKSSEIKLLLELENIKNDIFKNFKNSIITPKTPTNKKLKFISKSCKEAANEKMRKQTIVRIAKY